MINLNVLLLMGQPQEGQSPFISFLPLLLIILVFYFFMIRPQMKKQKELRNFRESLSKGDKIVTTGGIYGKINDISGQVVTMDVGNNVHIKVDKNAVLKDPTDLAGQR
ncbi:MAG: preprotein translocase subunit YajC [Bacteroidales bacterium]